MTTKIISFRCILRFWDRKKSDGAKSGEYGWCGRISIYIFIYSSGVQTHLNARDQQLWNFFNWCSHRPINCWSSILNVWFGGLLHTEIQWIPRHSPSPHFVPPLPPDICVEDDSYVCVICAQPNFLARLEQRPSHRLTSEISSHTFRTHTAALWHRCQEPKDNYSYR